MDKKLKEIESLLKQQKPSGLDTEFKRQIELIFTEKLVQLESLSKENKTIKFTHHQRIATAAAIVIAAIGSLFAFLNDSNRQDINSASTPIIGQPDKFIPIQTENIFEGVVEDNIFISEDKIPYQGIRYQFSDSFIWKNKNDGALIEMKVPSQRLFYVPIKTD
mgnify:CR=1 FL=1